MVVYDCPNLKHLYPLERCSRDIKEIKGESEWWESNKSDWGSEQHDYLVRVFVPLEDDYSNDELAEAVQVSLNMSQCGSGNYSSTCASGTGTDEPSGLCAGCGSNETRLFGVQVSKEPMRNSVCMNCLSHFQLTNESVNNANDGGYASAADDLHQQPGANQERKLGVPWTEEEHKLFLLGLEKYGKNWRGISRNLVITRTPTEVATHAWIHQNNLEHHHHLSYPFDITIDTVTATPALQPSSVIDTQPVLVQEHLPSPEISDTDGFPSSLEVASHTQNNFVHQNNLQRRRHLFCPFDITIDTVAATPKLWPSSVIDRWSVLLQENLPPWTKQSS